MVKYGSLQRVLGGRGDGTPAPRQYATVLIVCSPNCFEYTINRFNIYFYVLYIIYKT